MFHVGLPVMFFLEESMAINPERTGQICRRQVAVIPVKAGQYWDKLLTWSWGKKRKKNSVDTRLLPWRSFCPNWANTLQRRYKWWCKVTLMNIHAAHLYYTRLRLIWAILWVKAHKTKAVERRRVRLLSALLWIKYDRTFSVRIYRIIYSTNGREASHNNRPTINNFVSILIPITKVPVASQNYLSLLSYSMTLTFMIWWLRHNPCTIRSITFERK